MIKVRNLMSGTFEFADVDALINDTLSWYEGQEGECQMDVSEDDRLIMMTYTHFGFNDGDTSAVIIKDELPEEVSSDDLVNSIMRLSKACG